MLQDKEAKQNFAVVNSVSEQFIAVMKPNLEIEKTEVSTQS